MDSDVCQKPSCTANAVESWRGGHGNSVDVCQHHYWELVTGSRGQGRTNILPKTQPRNLLSDQMHFTRSTAQSLNPDPTVGIGVSDGRLGRRRDAAANE